MAKIKNIHHKRPEKKLFRIPSSVVQWGIVGIVAVVLVALVVGTLSRPPAEPGPVPLLSTAKTDLISITRMLGDVTLDSGTRSLFPEELVARLVGPDSLFAQRRWYDALNALHAMLKSASPPESAAIHAYMGFCQHEADNLDRSLQSFRKSLAADSSPTGLAPRLAFSMGWMFQSRGYQDSAIAYYSRVRRAIPAIRQVMIPPAAVNVKKSTWERIVAFGTTRLIRAEADNNQGAAYEAIKDTSAAVGMYREAAASLDTIAYPKELRTIRDNLARLTGGK